MLSKCFLLSGILGSWQRSKGTQQLSCASTRSVAEPAVISYLWTVTPPSPLSILVHTPGLVGSLQPRLVASPYQNFMALGWNNQESYLMPMEEPHRLLVYPRVDKELTFEWLVIQVGEGLSESWETKIPRESTNTGHFLLYVDSVFGVFMCNLICVPRCLVNDDWMQRQNK